MCPSRPIIEGDHMTSENDQVAHEALSGPLIPDEHKQRASHGATRNKELDSARYRWLRERDLSVIHDGGVFAGKTPDNIALNGDDLDQAIDDAMTAERE